MGHALLKKPIQEVQVLIIYALLARPGEKNKRTSSSEIRENSFICLKIKEVKVVKNRSRSVILRNVVIYLG